jgi:hypothetical protein
MGALRNVFMRRIYIRPHTGSFVIGVFANNAIAISHDANTLAPRNFPVKMFLVQSDLDNGGVVSIGDASVSLTNGIQLDPGRAMLFSVSNDDIIGSMFDTSMDWQEAIRKVKGMREQSPSNVFIDLADYYVCGNALNQRIRYYWNTASR